MHRLQFARFIAFFFNLRNTSIFFFNAKKIVEGVDLENDLILTCAHPSPLSANNGFFGCNHFIKCNEFLEKHNLTPIDWQIENV